MQHEMMRQPAPVHGSDKVGDVLASIRRLIAQDEAPSAIPNQLLNTLPRDAAAAKDEAVADIAPDAGAPAMEAWPQEALPELSQPDPASTEPLPLILNTSDLIAPGFPDTSAEIPAEAELAPQPQPWNAPPTTIDVAETTVESAPEAASEPLPQMIAPEAIVPETIVADAVWPETILSEPPEIARTPFSTARFDFNIEALWANLPDTDDPASDLASRLDRPDHSGPDIPAPMPAPTMPAPTMDDTAPQSLNLMQTEENMLQANASVTPINPHIDPGILAEIETQRDGGEPHLFAPQDKGAQKGTHLRGMIREAIRQELQGEIGNRLSRNLQQMIRHEIELTLRQMCEQE